MVKVTINLDTEVYRELISEAVQKYGTTKTLSRIVNEKLRKPKARVGEDIVKKTAGMWKIKESGYEYTKRIRGEWKKRAKALYDSLQIDNPEYQGL